MRGIPGDSAAGEAPTAGTDGTAQGRTGGFAATSVVSGLLAMLIFAGMFLLAARAWEHQLAERHQANLASEVASKRTRLESVINSLVHATVGLSAYVEARPHLDGDEFERMADRLYRRDPEVIRSLTLLAGSRIDFVYPREGNVDALGLDVASHPEQAASFRRVMETGETVVAGPWELAQGGTGLLVRSPVGPEETGDPLDEARQTDPGFTMASVAVDFERVLARAGFGRTPGALKFALQGRDGTGHRGEVFHDPDGIAEGPAEWRKTVSFAGGEWVLLARPVPEAMPTSRPPAWWAFGILGTLALGGLTWRVSGHVRDRARLLSQYHTLVANLEDATLVVRDTRVLWTNPAFRRTTGQSPVDGTSVKDLELFHPDDIPLLPNGLVFSREDPDPAGRQVRVRMADGHWRFHLLRWVPIPWEQDRAMLLILVDVHDNRMLFEALAQARDLQEALFEAMPGHALVLGEDGMIYRAFGDSRGAKEADASGRRGAGSIVGHGIEEFLPEAVARQFLAVVRRALDEGALQETEYLLEPGVLHPARRSEPELAGDGCENGQRWFEARVRPIAAHFEGRAAVVWHALDVTARRKLEERLHTLAWQDPLTAAANRAAMERAFPRMTSRARRDGGQLAMVFIDLDRFKPVNDEHGHAVGDQLLRRMSADLAAHLRAEDLLVRLGGDEFLVLTGTLISRDEVHPLIERIRSVFDTHWELTLDDGERISVVVTASIGVAFYPEHGETLADLIAAADQAMYRVKGQGRNAVAWAD
ncbi:diguanylate cyclase [Thioalkalivibrio sp. ALE20]|uniref:diguanylate cyclase n=1 Tax=Thioalkalivibrio sp. ALE20 TaxID=545275 RepID=UPI001E59046B|nr:diguanylate cyclase [Thioalkalivibrio sp. ALE20]